MNLETYCPEIRAFKNTDCRYRDDLIAAALRREIIKRGEWEAFVEWAYRKFARGIESLRRGVRGQQISEIDGPIELQFPGYILDPETFIRVAGEWVKTKEGL